MAKVELKQPVVAEISELFNGAKTAVCVDLSLIHIQMCIRDSGEGG